MKIKPKFVRREYYDKDTELNIDTITMKRLEEKGTVLTKLAIALRPRSIRISYYSVIMAFILLILVFISNTVTSTFTFGVTLLLGMLLLLPWALSRQVWDSEKAKVMLEYHRSSFRAGAYRFATLIRWIYVLAVIMVILFLIVGFFQGYWFV
ncbi:hypothetical protein CEE45_15185 [Candidatus Heimdallarchaeota archaeon B3_Heim]|nr:MAG: hypothetical protein CEE45_15185 [Candidatus Heimdallarchaeota archaeon B3_Heim]